MKLWTKSNDPKTILVLDITSGSVGAGLVKLNKKSVPTVINTSRTPLYLSTKPTTETLEKALLKSIRTSLEEVGTSSVERAIISFSSPWITSRLRTYVKDSKEQFSVDQRFVSKILNNEETEFCHDLEKEYTEESEIFDSRITNISLNGYGADLSIPKKANSIEVQFMLNAGKKSIINKIEESVVRIIGVEKGQSFENFMFVFMKVFTNSFQSIHSALLINMSSETSDFLLVKNSYPLLSISLPFGPASIARTIQNKLNIPLEVAYSYISLFSENALDAEMNRELDNIFIEIEAEWSRAWTGVLASLPGENIFPHKIFIVGSAPYESIIKTLLASAFDGHDVVVVDKKNPIFNHIIKTSHNLELDERISLLAAYANINF